MKNISTKIAITLFFTAGSLFAQYDGKDFAVGINGVYTTTAKIFLTPFSSDPVLRNNSFALSDIWNSALELKYRLTEPLIIGLSVEYMKHTERGPNLTVFDGSGTRTIMVEDGFKLIPIELSIYYILPFSSDNFKFLMGGGGGYYFGEHVRKFGDISVTNEDRKAAYGIQVAASIDYLLLNNLFIHFEMKFRDPQFTVKSRYPRRVVNYEGETVRLAQDTFDSKINIDGITFILGLLYQF